MRRNEIDESAADADLGANKTAAFSLASIQVEMMIAGENRCLGKNRDAILPALILQIEGERVLHLRKLREFRNFVDALCALDAAIDFLQTYEIRMLLIDDSSDTREVELLVHADAYMNVVGHHADLFGGGG